MTTHTNVHTIEIPHNLSDPDVLKTQSGGSGSLHNAKEIVVSLACIDRIDSTILAAVLRVYSYSARTGKRFRVQHVSAGLRQQLRELGIARPLLGPNQRFDSRATLQPAPSVESMQPVVRTDH